MKQLFSISGYLAIKEIWRNRGRFLLVSMVIALITLLVLFIAALGEGLGNGNREYISKLDAQLIVYPGEIRLSDCRPAVWGVTAWLPSAVSMAWQMRACSAQPTPPWFFPAKRRR